MRGHPLAGHLAQLLLGTFVTLLAVGCVAGPVAPTSPPGSVEVTITTAAGETTAFDPPETVVDADRPIAIKFRNASTLPHNLVFTAGWTATTRTIVEPGTSDDLLLSPLVAGAYSFVCTIHDGMSGTLVVTMAGSATE